jgi:hypothetical protein
MQIFFLFRRDGGLIEWKYEVFELLGSLDIVY